MGFEQIDEACRAGQRAENADFAAPSGTAGINPLKIEKRKIYVPFHLSSGGIVESGTSQGASGPYPGRALPNSGSAYVIAQASCPRGEIAAGESGILKILWEAAAGTTGDLRLVAELKTAIYGSAGLTVSMTRNVIQTTNSVANQLSIARMEFPPSVFNNNQLWGLKLSRDPSNSLDTLAQDVWIHGIWMEILGRC